MFDRGKARTIPLKAPVYPHFGICLEKVETAIESIFKRGMYKIVVNLKATKYVSSADFGCFISSLDTAMKNNGDLVFAATPPEIQDVFNILGLSKILRFAEDEKAALTHFK